MKKLTTPILIFLILLLPVMAAIPKIDSYVTDKADVLSSSTKTELEKTLRDLEKATNGVQYVIYIEKEYPKEYSIEEYTLKIAEENRIGKKGNDNGILLYVAVDDRQFRWEVGYGVEGTLSASLLGRISREYIVPNFKEGNYEKGIIEAVDVTGRILMGANDTDIVKLKNESVEKNPFAEFSKMVFIMLLIFIVISILFYAVSKSARSVPKNRHNDDFYKGAATGIFIGGFGRGGFGGGSGSFGGFSGGGGTFGGGGFGSRW